MFAASETFRWLRRWAVVAGVAIFRLMTVVTAYPDQMPAFHHLAVPAVAIIVPVWFVELSAPRWPRLVLVAATCFPIYGWRSSATTARAIRGWTGRPAC